MVAQQDVVCGARWTQLQASLSLVTKRKTRRNGCGGCVHEKEKTLPTQRDHSRTETAYAELSFGLPHNCQSKANIGHRKHRFLWGHPGRLQHVYQYQNWHEPCGSEGCGQLTFHRCRKQQYGLLMRQTGVRRNIQPQANPRIIHVVKQSQDMLIAQSW